MKIIDTNIISKHCSGEIEIDFSDHVYVTNELKDELEIHKSSFPDHKVNLQGIKFVDIGKYRYSDGEYFDDVKYLWHYKNLINKYTGITSFYGLKGLGDMSILATVATILGRSNPSLFDAQEEIEIFTHDSDLKEALSQEFGNQIVISDPLST